MKFKRKHAETWKRAAVTAAMIFICVLLSPACRGNAEEIQAVTMMEAAERVNVRSEPDAKSKVLGKLEKGERIFAVELTEEGWYRVVYQGETAYVKGDYLKIYGTSEGETSENPETTGPSGKIINPEEEVKKASEEAARRASEEEAARKASEETAKEASEEAARRESESIAQASAAAARQEAREQEITAIKKRSTRITIGVFAGAVLLIAVYGAYTIVKEGKAVQKPEKDGKKSGNMEQDGGEAGQESMDGEMEFLDLEQENIGERKKV